MVGVQQVVQVPWYTAASAPYEMGGSNWSVVFGSKARPSLGFGWTVKYGMLKFFLHNLHPVIMLLRIVPRGLSCQLV